MRVRENFQDSYFKRENNMTNNDKQVIDLVFGGAGPQRFPIYVGVLKAARDKGYIPERIEYEKVTSIHHRFPRGCGTSAGALVLGLYFSGMSIDEIEETIYDVDPVKLANITKTKLLKLALRTTCGYFVSKVTGKKYKWARPYLNSNKKIYNLLLKLTKEKTFSECPGLYIVATDTRTDEEFVFCNYRTPDVPIALGILASISLPIVFPGVVFPGECVECTYRKYGDVYNHVLMDGGLKNNFPVDYLEPIGNVPIIGVKVSDVSKRLGVEYSLLEIVKYAISSMITSRERKSIEDATYYGIINIDTGDEVSTQSNLSFEANEKSKKKWVDIGDKITYSNIDEAVQDSMLKLVSG